MLDEPGGAGLGVCEQRQQEGTISVETRDGKRGPESRGRRAWSGHWEQPCKGPGAGGVQSLGSRMLPGRVFQGETGLVRVDAALTGVCGRLSNGPQRCPGPDPGTHACVTSHGPRGAADGIVMDLG